MLLQYPVDLASMDGKVQPVHIKCLGDRQRAANRVYKNSLTGRLDTQTAPGDPAQGLLLLQEGAIALDLFRRQHRLDSGSGGVNYRFPLRPHAIGHGGQALAGVEEDRIDGSGQVQDSTSASTQGCFAPRRCETRGCLVS